MSEMTMKRSISPADLIPLSQYAAERKSRRQAVVAMKRDRRVEVGPFCTFYFENYDTMWHQVQEMLYIEKGGEEQVADELRAYNPLIPQGREIIATVMFEIEDPVRRARELTRLGGVEDTCTLSIGGETVKAVSESEVERTKEDGKTSSVHFFKFPLTDAQAATFKDLKTPAILGFGHPNYGHMAAIPENVRRSLIGDLD